VTSAGRESDGITWKWCASLMAYRSRKEKRECQLGGTSLTPEKKRRQCQLI